MAMKPSVRSAVCIAPSRAVWPPIQRIRQDHDHAFARWLPHVNLLYPFLPDDPQGVNFEQAAQRIHKALSSVQPFRVHMGRDELQHFGGHKCQLWLSPRDEDGVDASGCSNVHAALLQEFPAFKKKRGFTAHLSVGQCQHTRLKQLTAQLKREWPEEGISFDVSEVLLISRSATDPFHVRWTVPLGGVGEPQKHICEKSDKACELAYAAAHS